MFPFSLQKYEITLPQAEHDLIPKSLFQTVLNIKEKNVLISFRNTSGEVCDRLPQILLFLHGFRTYVKTKWTLHKGFTKNLSGIAPGCTFSKNSIK
jgi:hypothetical protein